MTISWNGMTAQSPALFPVIRSKGIRSFCTQPKARLDGAVKHDLTKGILTKFMIPVHPLAIDLMHAAQLPQIYQGNDKRYKQCYGPRGPP